MAETGLAVFDLGGTTIRDRGDVPSAFAAALHEADISFDPEEIQQWRGASKLEVLGMLVRRSQPGGGDDAGRVNRAYRAFQAALRTRLATRPDVAFPAALPCFERLAQAGWKVALNSGFDRDIVELILGAVAWPARLFSAIVCAGDVAAGRPAPDLILEAMDRSGVPDPAVVAVIGDTRLDMEAGANAGAALRIGVLCGAHDRSTLAHSPATHIVPDVSHVPEIILSAPSLQRPVGSPTPAGGTRA